MPKEEANGRVKILARARQTGLLLRGKLMATRFKFFNSSPAGIWEESLCSFRSSRGYYGKLVLFPDHEAYGIARNPKA